MAKVLMYTTPTCVYCRRVKAFFQEHNVEYQEIDVSSDHAAVEEMVKKSGQMGVPVIEIDGDIIIGYNEAALRDALKISS
jgi:glutaredoxin 3